MAKFRIRNLMGKVPWLDGLRLDVATFTCIHVIRFFERSYPTIRVYSPAAKKFLDEGNAALFAVQHGRMIGLLGIAEVRKKVSILISQSRDGEIISRVVENFGFSTARGSEKYRAVTGGLQMLRAAGAGQHLVVMVDGPRGPRYEVKPGIIKMAEVTGLTIIPFTASSPKHLVMWGWDRFMATDLGSPILHMYGDPITMPKDPSDEQKEGIRVELESQLEKLRQAADDYWSALNRTKTAAQRV